MGKKKQGQLRGLSDRTSDIILAAICLIIVFLVAYPLYYVLIASVSNPYDVYAGKTFLLPSGFTLDGYKAVFADKSIITGYLNSIKYTVVGTIFSVVMIYLSAYPLSVNDWGFCNFYSIILITYIFHYYYVFWRRSDAYISGCQRHWPDRYHLGYVYSGRSCREQYDHCPQFL